MAKCFIALMVLVAVCAVTANYPYDGCWNGYNYDCCRNRRPGLFYPSLVKPLPYYYRCVHRRVVYGRCAAHLCVNNHGICGRCVDRCSPHNSYYSRYFYGRYYYKCIHGALYYRACKLTQSYHPRLGRCDCRESYCERYTGWQSTVCHGCHKYVYCKYGRPFRYRTCRGYRPYFDCHRRRCVHVCNKCCGHR